MMEANNINGNYLINMHLNKNKIEISKLNPKPHYFINVLIINKKLAK